MENDEFPLSEKSLDISYQNMQNEMNERSPTEQNESEALKRSLNNKIFDKFKNIDPQLYFESIQKYLNKNYNQSKFKQVMSTNLDFGISDNQNNKVNKNRLEPQIPIFENDFNLSL